MAKKDAGASGQALSPDLALSSETTEAEAVLTPPGPVVATRRPYRLKPGAKFIVKRHEDGSVDRKGGGEVVRLTVDQAVAFADQIEPVEE